MSIYSIPAECYTCPYINLCEKNKTERSAFEPTVEDFSVIHVNGVGYKLNKELFDAMNKPRKSKHSNGDQFSSLLSKI